MQPEETRNPLHTDFRQLFFLKEGKALMGKRYRNAWVLVSILFVTFCAIGFANGSLDYLAHKMDDPFINWINLQVPRHRTDEIGKIKDRLNRPEVSEQFGFKNVTGNFSFALRFENLEKGGSFSFSGRSLELDNPLLEKILEPANLMMGSNFSGDEDAGLIVTEGLLKELAYPPDASHILMAYPTQNAEDAFIPLPIVAIVKELPGLTDFSTTPFFYRQRMISISGNPPFHPRNTQELLFFVEGEEKEARNFQASLEQFFSQNKSYSEYSPFPTPPNPNTLSHQPGYLVGVSLDPLPNEQVLKGIYASIREASEFGEYSFLRYFTPNFSNEEKSQEFDNLAINFADLGQIRAFKAYCNREFDLDIDMAQIEARENFNFVSKLTYAISLILIAFSVLSICLFLSSVFRRHLDKIRRNIGTFKAFGLDNFTLISTYLGMIGIFMVASIAISLFFSWIFGSLGGVRLLLRLVQDDLERGQNYFQLANSWTVIAVLSVLVISFFVLYQTANRILNRTPGDLIYDRE